jgi:hypothetical protein
METNPIPENFHKEYTDRIVGDVYWTEPGLQIIRCRFISDVGFSLWDLSYCMGTLPNGDVVNVLLPFSQLEKFTDGTRLHHNRINHQLIEYARADEVNAKKMGLLSHISTFNA